MAVVYGTEESEELAGTSGDDVIFGFGGDDWLIAGDGDDILHGGDGWDVMEGGRGSDWYVGGAGMDWFFVGRTLDGQDVIFDFDSFDQLYLTNVVTTSDVQQIQVVISRGGGASIIQSHAVGSEPSDARLFVYGNPIQGHDIAVTDNLYFTMFGDENADLLDAGALGDVLAGFGGDDRLVGRRGADILYGGEGADAFYVISAADSTMAAYDVIMDFETGVDQLNVIGLTQSNHDSFTIARFGGSSFIYFGREGQASAGVVVSRTDVNGSDILGGGTKPLNLVLYGSAAADDLGGGAGADTILGGEGDDVVFGGLGGDSLYGGAGADVFRLSQTGQSTTTTWDTILDFESGVDRLDLRGSADSVLLSSFGGSTFVYFDPDDAGGYEGLVIVNGTIVESDILVGPAPAGEPEPLILPAGSESKAGWPETPVICPSNGETEREAADWLRPAHRVHQVQDWDWIA